jgi:hypothetical protein
MFAAWESKIFQEYKLARSGNKPGRCLELVYLAHRWIERLIPHADWLRITFSLYIHRYIMSFTKSFSL